MTCITPRIRRFPAALLLLLLGWISHPVPVARAEVYLNPGATILFYGNSMVERLCEQGELEAWIQLAYPERKLHFRSLAWTGDEVGYRLRPEGYEEHLKTLLKQWPANVLVIGYGMNEAFGGAAGLDDFRSQLDTHLDQLERQHPGAKFVLLSPTLAEAGVPGQDSAARNRDIAAYAQVIGEAARTRGAIYVDLTRGNPEAQARLGGPLTVNGLHLSDAA
ncbi:MAG: GDSL-type esterase/lipase family protein, partial [Desulfobacterales bacterium]|nr:GDSL-type esterase/lipase family protein [Desulfobacterales bacterium]